MPLPLTVDGRCMVGRRARISSIFLALLLSHVSTSTPTAAQEDVPGVATFSILGYDPETGELGGAVQSRVFSVGNGVLWAEAGVGAVVTQAIVDVSYGPQGLELLETGCRRRR